MDSLSKATALKKETAKSCEEIGGRFQQLIKEKKAVCTRDVLEEIMKSRITLLNQQDELATQHVVLTKPAIHSDEPAMPIF